MCSYTFIVYGNKDVKNYPRTKGDLYYYYKGRFIKNQQNYTKTNTVIYKCI